MCRDTAWKLQNLPFPLHAAEVCDVHQDLFFLLVHNLAWSRRSEMLKGPACEGSRRGCVNTGDVVSILNAGRIRTGRVLSPKPFPAWPYICTYTDI